MYVNNMPKTYYKYHLYLIIISLQELYERIISLIYTNQLPIQYTKLISFESLYFKYRYFKTTNLHECRTVTIIVIIFTITMKYNATFITSNILIALKAIATN